MCPPDPLDPRGPPAPLDRRGPPRLFYDVPMTSLVRIMAPSPLRDRAHSSIWGRYYKHRPADASGRSVNSALTLVASTYRRYLQAIGVASTRGVNSQGGIEAGINQGRQLTREVAWRHQLWASTVGINSWHQLRHQLWASTLGINSPAQPAKLPKSPGELETFWPQGRAEELGKLQGGPWTATGGGAIGGGGNRCASCNSVLAAHSRQNTTGPW